MYLSKTQGQQPQPQSVLQVSTIRSFDGGLNVADTDLNMSPKYARVLDNIERDIDGSNALRAGTVLLTNQIADPSNIINHVYFNNVVVAVQASGNVTFTDGTGHVTVKTLTPGGGLPWPSGVTYVDFTIFNSDLIIVNGRNKPLLIPGHTTDPNYMNVLLLQDKGSGTNVNTPIGKYVIAHGQYTIIAGVPTNPSTIYVSAKGTSGTFPGDPAPNDAIALDLGPRVSLGSATITGLVAYRDKLLVTFERGVLPVNLGVYTGSPSVHTPTDDGFIEEFGCMSHRSLISVGDDTFFVDNVGVNSINRVNVFNTLRPIRASHLIDPLISAGLQALTQAQIDQYVFAVYNMRKFRYMLFVPTFDASNNLVETICYTYTDIPALKIQSWARLRGWKWQSACRTSLQNIIFSQGNKLYYSDFDNPTGGSDYRNDPAYNGGAGIPISFEWELPWADFKHRMDIKFMRYIAFDTQGSAKFTVECYVDNLVYSQGNRVPLLSMDFYGGDVEGYGSVPYGNSPYGGGRLTADERLYAYVAKFKLMKLRIVGSSTMKLRFVSISIAYVHGSIRR